MKPEQALSNLKAEDAKIVRLKHIIAALSWDQDISMPVLGSEERGEQIALLSSLIHRYSNSSSLREAVDALDGVALSDSDKALLRYWKKETDRASKLPEKLVHDISIATNEAHYAWLEAREKDQWKLFEPALDRVFQLTKEQASLLGEGKSYYDTLLDLYEEGMTSETIDRLFDDLEVATHTLMDKLDGVEVDDSFLFEAYDETKLHSFCLSLIDQMGFDKNRGIVGITAHPYTTALGVDDHRISTRYSDASLFDPIGSIVHETGHALYEMSASKASAIRGTSLGEGVSMGVHESQSRFWENLMGRSFSFWEFQYPKLQEAIPNLKAVSLERFVKAINKTQPSAIRVNADELTYNLHIILRYRIEKELFEGALKVKDIPSRWRELSKTIVRYEVRSDREGALQDVHWSQGSFGYFPTYAIGNIYSAAFYKRLCEDLGGKDAIDSALRCGDYGKITAWQDKNIWSKGGIYPPAVLVEGVTGEKVDVTPFKEYLVTKFCELYRG